MSLPFAQLPTLGLGASLSLSAQPDPVKLAQTPGGPSFIEYSGLVDVERVQGEIDRIQDADVPVLFHPSFINFCGSHSNSQQWLTATTKHINSVGSAWFAQDCAYCFWQEGHGYSSQFGYFIPPILNPASLALAIQRVQEVQAASQVTVAIEPPPVSFVVGKMPVLEFFGQLANVTNCALLLDMGHLVSYQMAGGQSIIDQISSLPVERVIEIHIAGGRIKDAEQGPIYIDAHEADILDEVWHMLEQLLPLLPNVKALCYECEGVAQPKVLDVLQRLEQLIIKNSASTALVAKVQERLA